MWSALSRMRSHLPARAACALRQAQGVVSLSPLDYARGDPEPVEGSNHGAEGRCPWLSIFVTFVTFVVDSSLHYFKTKLASPPVDGATSTVCVCCRTPSYHAVTR